MSIQAKSFVLRVLSACVVLLGCLVWSVPAAAQVLGELKGRISDPSGAAIPAADITLTLTASDIAQTTKTTSAGEYVFSQLTSGVYRLHVSRPGFATLDRVGITVTTGQTVSLDIALK